MLTVSGGTLKPGYTGTEAVGRGSGPSFPTPEQSLPQKFPSFPDPFRPAALICVILPSINLLSVAMMAKAALAL